MLTINWAYCCKSGENLRRPSRSFRRFSNSIPSTLRLEITWLGCWPTCPENSLRDGKKVVELAQQAVQLSGGRAPEILDPLAAAYAEAGPFPIAIETARQVLDLSTAQNNKPLAEVIQNQLQLFEANSPHHEKL